MKKTLLKKLMLSILFMAAFIAPQTVRGANESFTINSQADWWSFRSLVTTWSGDCAVTLNCDVEVGDNAGLSIGSSSLITSLTINGNDHSFKPKVFVYRDIDLTFNDVDITNKGLELFGTGVHNFFFSGTSSIKFDGRIDASALTLSGTGTLNIKSSLTLLYGEITVSGGTVESMEITAKSLSVINDAVLNVSSDFNPAIQVNGEENGVGELIVKDGGKLTTTGSSGSGNIRGNVYVDGASSVVDVKGSISRDLTVKGGTVTVGGEVWGITTHTGGTLNGQPAPKETVTFVWKGSTSAKRISIGATLGKTFTIDWGNGSTSHTGEGFWTDITQDTPYNDNNEHTVTITADEGCSFDYLSLDFRDVISLDVSGAPALTSLNCTGNWLMSLDASKNTALITLDCSFNELTSLDVSNNPALTKLVFNLNKLTSLDVSYNPLLTSLECDDNDIISLDVSNNLELTELYCSGNKITSLDVSNNLGLTVLYCAENKLTSLDVSNNPLLTSLNCETNSIPLVELKVLSDIASIPTDDKYLGKQTLPLVVVEPNTAITIDSVFNGVNTTFKVTVDDSATVADTDYTITGGTITFLHKGMFNVSITNPGLISNEYYPAEVIARFDVGNLSSDAPPADLSEGIQIYPNVITDYFHIKGVSRPTAVSVYTLYGEMVMQREAQAEENISAGNLPSGVYLIAVEGKAFKVIKK